MHRKKKFDYQLNMRTIKKKVKMKSDNKKITYNDPRYLPTFLKNGGNS